MCNTHYSSEAIASAFQKMPELRYAKCIPEMLALRVSELGVFGVLDLAAR
jgi:hypothetical protein